MNYIYSTVNSLRDKYAPPTTVSTFRKTGEITAQEFLAAGDYLVYKFPTYRWVGADPSDCVSYLPPGKQYLVTRHLVSERRVNDDFAGNAGHQESVVEATRDDDGWLRTGGLDSSQPLKAREVRTVDDAGNVGEAVEDDIPDIEEEDDDEAIIPDEAAKHSGRRTYTLYISYSTYYRTPRAWLQGYQADGEPLDPELVMEDIAGEKKGQTVTIEEFPFVKVKMASVHPCLHAPTMKRQLDNADAARQRRRDKLKAGLAPGSQLGLEGLVDDINNMTINNTMSAEEDIRRQEMRQRPHHGGGSIDETAVATAAEPAQAAQTASDNGEDWEELIPGDDDLEAAIRVDQYLVVFLKFLAGVAPGIELDYTIGV